MTWDNDRIWQRVDELDIPSKLQQWLEEKWPVPRLSLQIERVRDGKNTMPTAGVFSVEGETPLEVGQCVAGYALAVLREYGNSATGKIRARSSTPRSSCDFWDHEIGRGFENSESNPVEDFSPINECRGCRAYELVITGLQSDNQSLRDLLSRTNETMVTQMLELTDRGHDRIEKLADRSNDRLEIERSARDSTVERIVTMAERVLNPSNDATARTLGILDKGVALTAAALESLESSATRTRDDRQAERKKQMVEKLIEMASAIGTPLIAARLGIEIPEIQKMSSQDKDLDLENLTPENKLLLFRDGVFELTNDDHWAAVEPVLGEKLTARMLALKTASPIDAREVLSIGDELRDLGPMKMLALGKILPEKAITILIALPDAAREVLNVD